jgi:ribonuclease BN (tRNA processing enzyme)
MPRPGGASSSYLVQAGEAAVLFDIGGGAAGKLQLAIEYPLLDAVVISHMHADHFFDLVPLRYGLKYGSGPRADRLPLWLPPGGAVALEALRRAVAADAPDDFFDSVFAVREYDPAKRLEVKDLRLSFRRTHHYVEAFAVRVDRDGASITYSADTAPCDAVVEHAATSSLFLCEAALGLDTEEGSRGHSSAYEAGEMARRAGVARLVLTHYPARYDAHALVEAARSRFTGPISAAEDGGQFSVLGSPRGSEN